MLIAFVHNHQAFLPEITAYTRYFTKAGFECQVVEPKNLYKLQPKVAWHFMGMDMQPKRPGVLTVHEYTSASLPPLRGPKDFIKKMLNVQADYRLFLNDYVRDRFAFTDDVPYGYRDMGVQEEWLRSVPTNKEYDFIYVGQLRKGITALFDVFKNGAMKGRSLLVVSDNYETLRRQYSEITFTGPLPHEQVHELVRKARYGINFIPQTEPFNCQTSTKFLEYCACGVPVVSSDYFWMWEFEEKYGGQYFYLEDDLSNFKWENVQGFNYKFPDLTDWTWDRQIERSGILQVLEKLR